MQYLLLNHNNITPRTVDAEWAGFIGRAKKSGTLRDGSEIRDCE